MTDILEHILGAPAEPAPMEGLAAWWDHQRQLPFARPIERAMAGGFAADRPAYAFAAGYQETLQQLLGGATGVPTAFCATEEGGAHPRAIQTALTPDGDRLRLTGSKRFVTLGTFARELLVVARTGERDGRPALAVVRVDAARAGVSLEALPELPFVPEIPHARVGLDGVVVQPDEVLAGDGYLGYLKPMRTVEDCHVVAALLAWVVGVARRSQWPTAVIEDLLVPLAALRDLAQRDPLAPGTHLSLQGALRQADALLGAAGPEWARVDPATAARWRRDSALLNVAASARDRRTEAAWKRLGR